MPVFAQTGFSGLLLSYSKEVESPNKQSMLLLHFKFVNLSEISTCGKIFSAPTSLVFTVAAGECELEPLPPGFCWVPVPFSEQQEWFISMGWMHGCELGMHRTQDVGSFTF